MQQSQLLLLFANAQDAVGHCATSRLSRCMMKRLLLAPGRQRRQRAGALNTQAQG
jgi:hypothetical protein